MELIAICVGFLIGIFLARKALIVRDPGEIMFYGVAALVVLSLSVLLSALYIAST